MDRGLEGDGAGIAVAQFISSASFWLPQKLTRPYAWVEHIPFAFWLVGALRPKCFVELGVHTGNSYFAFCQAIEAHRLDCRSYAVDTWLGDAQAGFYGEEVFEEFAHYHAAKYSTFSVFIRGVFDEAHQQFADNSIDLLHIDGTHSYNEVKHDFHFWLPKLSERGVVVLHDTNVRGRNFGVHQLWNELTPRFPHFEFKHGYGLGLLGVGRAIPPRFNNLLRLSDDSTTSHDIRTSYAGLGAHVALMATTGDRSREIEHLRDVVTAQSRRSLRKSFMRRWTKLTRKMRDWSVAHNAPANALVDLSQDTIVPPAGRKISIVVCVHNAHEDVRHCLESLLEHSREPREIILIDDGSAPETRDFLETFSREQHVPLIRHETAIGYTTSANEGIGASSGDYVVLLNSDTVVTAKWLEAIEQAFDNNPRTGIVGPLSNTASWQSIPTVMEDGDWASNPLPAGFDISDVGRMVAERQPRYHELPFINGFCFAIRTSVLADIGILDADTFPAGYDEENDFCIRTRQRGWELRVVDNCYTWHAQSKSFSHERRKRLAAESRLKLVKKYDEQREINVPAAFCRASLGMAGLREWTRRRFEREALIRKIGKNYSGARLAVVLPVAGTCGGANVVLQEMEALRRFGIEVSLLNIETARAGVLRDYPATKNSWLFAANVKAIPATIQANGPFDAIIATAYLSTFWTPRQDELPTGTRSAYYIQDYEPLFYDRDDLATHLADASYRWDLKQLLFTKTIWTRNRIAAESGRIPHVIGMSVDVDRFQPVDRFRSWPPAGGVRICAMVRPSTIRRAPENTYRLLARIASHFGDIVQCHSFGCADEELVVYRRKYSGKVFHHGTLSWQKMSKFLNAMDVFVDLSDWQAMGLTLMEAMASGLLVIGPNKGGTAEVVSHGRNGFLVDTAEESAAFAVIEEMIKNTHDIMTLRENAVITAHSLYPENAAAALATLVLSDPQTGV